MARTRCCWGRLSRARMSERIALRAALQRLQPASIALRFGSRNGGSASRSPSLSAARRSQSPDRRLRSRTARRRARGNRGCGNRSGRSRRSSQCRIRRAVRPRMILRLVGRAEGHVMHAACALPRGGQIAPLDHMQFGRRPALAHLEHMRRGRRRGVVARPPHVHDFGQHARGARQLRHGQRDRTEPADLMLRRNRAAVPRQTPRPPAIIHQRQPLALEILELQRQPAVDLGDVADAIAEPPSAGRARSPASFHRSRGRPCATRVREPRTSRSTGQSKKVMSVPGLAFASA